MSAPAQPLPSASVILLDPRRGEGEPFGLYLLKRQQKSSFMPNRFVFPGGRVEPSDGPDPWAEEALRTCALRELWEEAGVVLHEGPFPGHDRVQAARQALLAGQTGLGEALAGLGLTPRPQALWPYARWITPTARPKRFDTLFYVALMPPEQEAAADQQETSQGLWLGPLAALAENQAGRVELAPPQVIILGQLAACPRLDALLMACGQADLSPVQPVLWAQGPGREALRVILLPGDPDYAMGAPGDPAHPGRPCPAHQASRLVHQEGRWLPHQAA